MCGGGERMGGGGQQRKNRPLDFRHKLKIDASQDFFPGSYQTAGARSHFGSFLAKFIGFLRRG